MGAVSGIVLAGPVPGAEGEVSAGKSGLARAYVGQVGDDPAATVSLIVEKSGPRQARFEAENFEVQCDDGTTLRARIPPQDFSFQSKRVFQGERYSSMAMGQVFYKVRGKLLSGGRAKGYILFIGDQFDPPGGIFSDDPDCSSRGRLRWTASREGT